MFGLLARQFRALNDRYHGDEGDALAIAELAPVARRFVPSGGRVLEIGCGYGRNLVALATLDAGLVVGSDPVLGELEQARARVDAARTVGERVAPAAARDGAGGANNAPRLRAPVSLVRQEDLRLPFRDGAFDLVVLWQVLEHVFGRTRKCAVISEAVRVLKPGGHVLIETPNKWFPFDYHDNKMPFVHWTGPQALREWLTWKIRGKRYTPSEYLSLPACERLLREAPGVRGVTRATRVYFAPGFRAAWRDLGGTQVAAKRVIFAAAAPLHAVLARFGGSADYVLPSLRIVWRVEK